MQAARPFWRQPLTTGTMPLNAIHVWAGHPISEPRWIFTSLQESKMPNLHSEESLWSRRSFLSHTACSLTAMGVASLLPGCASKRVSPGRTNPSQVTVEHNARLGLDTYTLHRCLSAKDPALRKDLWWVTGLLEKHGLSGLQIDPSHFPGDDSATLDRLYAATVERGHYVEFGMGGWDVDRMRQRIELTARFGGRALRTFCGGENDGPEKLAIYMKYAPGALAEAGKIAEDHDVDIAVENHGDFTSVQLAELLDKAGHPRVGCCFDTGNSLFRREDPLVAAKNLAPYSTSMHLKDWVMRFDDEGHPVWSERVLEQGQVPIAQCLDIVLAEKPDLYIALETPVYPGDDEAETVAREFKHFQACTAAARKILKLNRA